MSKNKTILSAFENSSFIKNAGTIIAFIALLILLVSRNTQGISDKLFWTDEVYIYQTVIQPFWVIPIWTMNGYYMQPPLFTGSATLSRRSGSPKRAVLAV